MRQCSLFAIKFILKKYLRNIALLMYLSLKWVKKEEIVVIIL